MTEEKIIPLQADKSEKPEKPGLDDCCGSSCPNCVWDVYYEELGQWREKQGLPAYGNSLQDET